MINGIIAVIGVIGIVLSRYFYSEEIGGAIVFDIISTAILVLSILEYYDVITIF